LTHHRRRPCKSTTTARSLFGKTFILQRQVDWDRYTCTSARS